MFLIFVSVELVHHFLGYNSWSSQIVEIAGLEFNQLEDGFYMSRFKCVVKLTFKVWRRRKKSERRGVYERG
jgi:hypothetical protein